MVDRKWRSVVASDITGSWDAVAKTVLAAVTSGQLAAAAAAEPYLRSVLTEQGLPNDPAGTVQPAMLAGIAPDGRDLGSLLEEGRIRALDRIGQGDPPTSALAQGLMRLQLITTTVLQDTGRTAVGVGVAVRSRVGYVRLLNPPSCSRCIVLAGKWFRWNQGFARHPKCDCRHVPSREDVAGDLRTDPSAYVQSLGISEQDRILTKAGAQAIRDGADLAQVVNARRGASGLSIAGARITDAERASLIGGTGQASLSTVEVYGRQLAVTTEGTTIRGVAGQRLASNGTERAPGSRYRSARAPRLMPEAIYQIARDRTEAIGLLRRFGYIL
jgi:hypothetical protein